MLNQFNLDDEIGWSAAADLATRLGWRDGKGLFPKMTAKELSRAMQITARLFNLKTGHVQNLRTIYGAAYWSAAIVAKKHLKEPTK